MLAYKDHRSYLAKVVMASGAGRKTVFVEGDTDKKVLSAVLVVVKGKIDDSEVVVDTPKMINDWPDGIVGNRERVEYVHSVVQPIVGDKFFSVVDREWRGFEIAERNCCVDLHRSEHCPAINLMWTRGHSIENYFFHPEYMLDHCRRSAPEEYTHALTVIIGNQYWNCLMDVSALTYALMKYSLINKSGGVIDCACWKRGDGVMRLDLARVVNALRGRSATDVQLEGVRSTFEDIRKGLSVEVARWMCHGHIGMEGMSAALIVMMMEAGVETGSANKVGCAREGRVRCYADMFARGVAEGRVDCLGEFGRWIKEGHG